jgi:hypothetical protein
MAGAGVIGGHLGMDVTRTPQGIMKRALQRDGTEAYKLNIAGLRNEAKMLRAMAGTGVAPDLIHEGPDYIVQVDLGESEPITDGEAFRRSMMLALAHTRARGLRHGDFTGSNIITRGNRVWLIDWQESHRIGEPAPQKQPVSDSSLVMRTIEGSSATDGNADTPRIARRWKAVIDYLGAHVDFEMPLRGKTFIDLGCFMGDFVALAALEGMRAVGIDRGGFRTGEDSIDLGNEVWASFPWGKGLLPIPSLLHGDIVNVVNGYEEWPNDYAMMFSTWPYIVEEYGWPVAVHVLDRICDRSEVFFFETQLAGDGPGPELLKTKADVAQMFIDMGHTPVELVTIPVTGRPAERTVWAVT